MEAEQLVVSPVAIAEVKSASSSTSASSNSLPVASGEPFQKTRRNLSSVNAVAAYPQRVMLVLADRSGVLRPNDERVLGVERVERDGERRHQFSVECIEGTDAFVLKNCKTNQCLGCLNRAGQVIAHTFEYTVNRSRELIWRREPNPNGNGSFRLKNESFGMYLGPVETSKPKNLGCVILVEEQSLAKDFFMDICKVQWSFNSGGKALTALPDGQLALQSKGIFAWSPYFELDPYDGGGTDRFSIRCARPAADDFQYVTLEEIASNSNSNNTNTSPTGGLFSSAGVSYRVCLTRTRCPWVLVPTLKRGVFYIRHVLTKRLLAVATAEMITSTESVHTSLTWTLSDVKGAEFGGQLQEPAISEQWTHLEKQLKKHTKHPVAHPVFAHLVNVLEREMSAFASIYFIARCNAAESAQQSCNNMRPLLNPKEKVLLSNVEQAFNMIPAIMQKDTALYKALDRAVANAKEAVSASEKLFHRYAELDHPHVTSFRLEEDAMIRIAIVSDFGTGKPKARQLLDALFRHEETRPNMFIHLGDVYKKGTQREQLEHFIEPLCSAINKYPGAPVRVYDLPGNHDYLNKGGEGYYWALDELRRRNLSQQRCSFFCAHIGEKFTVIGLDTSLECLKYDTDALETRLNEDQMTWLRQRMDEAKVSDRKVILLTHHPVLASGPIQFGQVNFTLWEQLSPYFPFVAAFFWGHEHSFNIYQPYTGRDGRTLLRGRLVGHGAKWKKAKNNTVPVVKVDHPKAREIGLAILELGPKSGIARYMELSGEGDSLSLVENFQEELSVNE